MQLLSGTAPSGAVVVYAAGGALGVHFVYPCHIRHADPDRPAVTRPPQSCRTNARRPSTSLQTDHLARWPGRASVETPAGSVAAKAPIVKARSAALAHLPGWWAQVQRRLFGALSQPSASISILRPPASGSPRVTTGEGCLGDGVNGRVSAECRWVAARKVAALRSCEGKTLR